MGRDNVEELSRRLKDSGLTCAKLKKLVNRQRKDMQTFRRIGFNKLAKKEQEVGVALKSLKNKVCRKI